MVVALVHHGRAPDGAVHGPRDQGAPGEDGQADDAEDDADGDEDGSLGDGGFLHVGRVGGWGDCDDGH